MNATVAENTLPTLSPARLKAQFNLRHADKAAYHRYDLDGDAVTLATSSIEAHLCGGLPLCEVRMLRPDRDHKHRTLFAVRVEAEWLPIVWCHSTKSPVTILPQSALIAYESFLNGQPKTAAATPAPVAFSPPPPVDPCGLRTADNARGLRGDAIGERGGDPGMRNRIAGMWRRSRETGGTQPATQQAARPWQSPEDAGKDAEDGSKTRIVLKAAQAYLEQHGICV